MRGVHGQGSGALPVAPPRGAAAAGARGAAGLASVALVALLLIPSPARARNDMALTVGPVEAVGGAICVSWQVGNPFTPRLLETLDQGMPARVVYEVGVWKKRTFWFDKLCDAIRSEHKVVYDALSGRYRLRSGTGPPRESTFESFESLSARLFTQRRLPLVLASELDSTATYYVSVKTTIRPLSPEDLAEVEGWLSGGAGVQHTLPEYLMALAVSLSGLGDRTALEKSERWKPAWLTANAGAAKP